MGHSRRHLKLVQTVENPQTYERAEIFFHTEHLTFQCWIDGDHKSGKAADEVMAWARKQLESRAHLTWTPVIQIFVAAEAEVNFSGQSRGAPERGEWIGNPAFDRRAKRMMAGFDVAAASCELEFRRIYIAKNAKGWRLLNWDRYNAEDPTAMLGESDQSWSGSHWPDGFKGQLPHIDRGDESRGHHRIKKLMPGYETRALIAYSEAAWTNLCALCEVLDSARERLTALVGEPKRLELGANALLAIAGAKT